MKLAARILVPSHDAATCISKIRPVSGGDDVPASTMDYLLPKAQSHRSRDLLSSMIQSRSFGTSADTTRPRRPL